MVGVRDRSPARNAGSGPFEPTLLRPHEEVGKPEGDLGDVGQDDEHQGQRNQERDHRSRDPLEGGPAHLGHDVERDAERRRQDAEHQHEGGDYAEVDAVDSHQVGDGKQDGRQDDHRRQRVEHAADDQEEDQVDREKEPLAVDVGEHRVREVLRHLLDRHDPSHDHRKAEHHHDQCREQHGLGQRLPDLAPRDRPEQEPDEDRVGAGEDAGLRGGGVAGGHRHHDDRRRAESGDPVDGKAQDRAERHPRLDRDGKARDVEAGEDHQSQADEQARDDPGEEQAADRGRRHVGVDQERDRGRNDRPDDRGGRGDRRREVHRVAALLHRLDLDHAETRAIGDRGARHAGEDHRADDVHLGQPAPQPADESGGEVEDAVRHLELVEQAAGHDEEGHRQQRAAEYPLEDLLGQDVQRIAEVGVDESEHRRARKAHDDRHGQDREDQEYPQQEQRGDHGRWGVPAARGGGALPETTRSTTCTRALSRMRAELASRGTDCTQRGTPMSSCTPACRGR